MQAKRRRTIPADKARAAVMGGFYDRIVPSAAPCEKCVDCHEPTRMIGADGLCLKCRLERKRQAREATGQAGFIDGKG